VVDIWPFLPPALAFRASFLGNPPRSWLVAMGLTALSLVVLKLIHQAGVSRLTRLALRTATELDDLLVEVLESTRFLVALAVSLYFGSYALDLSPLVEHYLRTALMLALLFQGAVWTTTGASFLMNRAIQRRRTTDMGSATALLAVNFVVKAALWSLFLLWALANLGVNVTGVVAGLGVGGIAVALAVQNILGDLFASLSIVLDKPFVIGEFIIVDEYLGTIERIGLKTTRIRSLWGEQVIISNGDLLKSRIKNYSRMRERRVQFGFQVPLETSAEALAAIGGWVKEIIQGVGRTRFDRAHFKETSNGVHVFEVIYYVLDPDYNIYMDIQQEINLGILRRFQAEGVRFAVPVRSLSLRRESPRRG
jgi:small-conductance mechanosensitive channel